MTASLGHIILAHENLDRVAQFAKYLLDAGCPVVIHVDDKTADSEFQSLQDTLMDQPLLRYLAREKTEWGCFTLVKVSLAASKLMLETFPDVNHVMLSSGTCLPTKPVAQLIEYLDRRRGTDFIESYSLENEQWVHDGLDKERFTLFFPFSWRNSRRLFDLSTKVQRWLKVNRKMPNGQVPYLGSQWWCLTRQTLRLILDDPDRTKIDRFFKLAWIPDESYFQTQARKHSERLESRSLTWAKFDYQGKPFHLYDDHLAMVSKTETFMARKIWHKADKLYQELLSPTREFQPISKSNQRKFNQKFDAAIERNRSSKTGLTNAGRFPYPILEHSDFTARPYTVLMGARFVYPNLNEWVIGNSDCLCHGNLFGRKAVEFQNGTNYFAGNLTKNRALRNYKPQAFLSNLIWNKREKQQCFFFDLDDFQRARDAILKDPNATILLVDEVWILQFWNLRKTGEDLPSKAKMLYAAEQRLNKVIARPSTQANIIRFDLENVIESPMEFLHALSENISTRKESRLMEPPKMIDLSGLNDCIHKLKNSGFSIKTERIIRKNHGAGHKDAISFQPKLVKK